MIFNTQTDKPASYTNNSTTNNTKIVRLIEDPDVKKTIKFDELSVKDIPDPILSQNKESKEKLMGLEFPVIRINDIVLERKNIGSLKISLESFMPTIFLSIFFDNENFKSKNVPKDGDFISIFIRTSTDALNYLRDDFIITNCITSSSQQESVGNSIKLMGKLFIPGFDAKSGTGSYPGTSRSVIKEIAKNYGIGFAFNDYEDTCDFQNWLRCRQTIQDYITDITSHAWKNETSFFKTWIDLYYNICFVNINKFLLSSENEEDIDITFATKITDLFNQNDFDSSAGVAKASFKILTNLSDFFDTPFYIRSWKPINDSYQVSSSNGYSTSTYSFIHNQNIINSDDYYCFETLNNIPAYDQNKVNNHILLRGRASYDKDKNPDDEMSRVNYDFVNTYTESQWTGVEYVMSDDDKDKNPSQWSGNVHKNYNRAPFHNNQNLKELDKIYLSVSCNGLNLQIMKGERVPVLIILSNELSNSAYNNSKNDIKRNYDKFYSGYYIVDSIEYSYNPGIKSDGNLSPFMTKFTLKRREWPTPEEIL